MMTAARPVIAAQPGLVSLPAATNPAAGRTSASTKAHRVNTCAATYRAKRSHPSNHAMPRAYPQDCSDPGCTTRDSTGPRSAVRSSGALSMIRRQLPVFFFAGTAVGSARRAVRARVTVDEVAFAGDFLAAGLFFLAGVTLAAADSAGVAF